MKNNFPQLSVSILNSDFSDLNGTLRILYKSKIKYIHLDVMDGNFVPNLTFGPPVIRSIKLRTEKIDCILDTHLMINCPQKSVEQYINVGADIITFHYESLDEKDIHKLISVVKKHKKLVGISIKPQTPAAKITKYLKHVDMVLVMTVTPGFGGQKIINSSVKKIHYFKSYRSENNLSYIISADGGINEKNIVDIVKSGCDLPVVGNAIFGSKDVESKIKLLQTLIK